MKHHPIADVWPMMDEAKLHELADVALGDELQRLRADGQRRARLGRVAQLQDLQLEALGEVARTHAGPVHVLQQLQVGAQQLLAGLAALGGFGRVGVVAIVAGIVAHYGAQWLGLRTRRADSPSALLFTREPRDS